MKSFRLGDLHKDPELSGLRKVNNFVVSRYRQAMATGSSFPPMCVTNNRSCVPEGTIIGGQHRYAAKMQLYGADHVELCSTIQVPDRKSLLMEFVLDNKEHGLPPTSFTRKASAAALLTAGATPEQVAGLFGITTQRLEVWGHDTVMVILGEQVENKVVKRGAPQAPAAILEEQYQEHAKHALGITAVEAAQQILHHFDCDWVDVHDAYTCMILGRLRDVLIAQIPRAVPQPKERSTDNEQAAG